MVLTPSLKDYDGLTKLVASGSWDGADQSLLNGEKFSLG